MKKLLLIFLITISTSKLLFSGCPIINVPLEQRVSESTLIVEATVLHKESYYNSTQNFIYTAHTLKIHKVLKGNPYDATITFITEGGIVDDWMLNVSPNLETQINQTGVFFLSENQSWPNPNGVYTSFYSPIGPLGFIYYDDEKTEAFDLVNRWYDVNQFFITKLAELTGYFKIISHIEVINLDGFRRNTPVISSFSPTSIPAGTRQILTIIGSNFGSIRGTNGKVQFRNADDGGNTYIDALASDYISWSDTMIRLLVLRRAGTGTFRVRNNLNNFINSSTSLTIPWSHLNVESGTTPISYETRLTGTNGNNGITWNWDSRFRTDQAAVESFIRALETWRCNTLVNWDTGVVMNNDTMLRDNQNMVFWDKGWMGGSTLGVCYSWYSGCGVPPNMNWYVAELDIVFRKSVNWQFGPANPTGGRSDFESVALHELGHGHQLGHVINTSNVMHFSIAANTTRRVLQANDTACGNYVMNKSTTSVCSRPRMNKININDCRLSSLFANFTTNKTSSICLFDEVVFSNASSSEATSWTWNFGSGATPQSVNGIGPHTVSYATGGAKTVSLQIGSGTETRSITNTEAVVVVNNQKPVVDFDVQFVGGFNYFFQNTSLGTSNYTWDFGDGSPTSTAFSPTHFYSEDPKDFLVTLSAANFCGSDQKQRVLGDFTNIQSITSENIWSVYPNPANDFLYIKNLKQIPNAEVTIEIFDLKGNAVLQNVFMPNQENKVDLSSLHSGYYFIKIANEKGHYTQSLIKH